MSPVPLLPVSRIALCLRYIGGAKEQNAIVDTFLYMYPYPMFLFTLSFRRMDAVKVLNNFQIHPSNRKKGAL